MTECGPTHHRVRHTRSHCELSLFPCKISKFHMCKIAILLRTCGGVCVCGVERTCVSYLCSGQTHKIGKYGIIFVHRIILFEKTLKRKKKKCSPANAFKWFVQIVNVLTAHSHIYCLPLARTRMISARAPLPIVFAAHLFSKSLLLFLLARHILAKPQPLSIRTHTRHKQSNKTEKSQLD